MKSNNSKNKPRYHLDKNGCFVIDDYNKAKPFSNFLPGVAGVWGIPMWVFYVNRGQGIASFGIEGKDKAILEFQPANKAYRQTSLQGFRTFLKVSSGSRTATWEPFQNNCYQFTFGSRQKMLMTPHDLILEDTSPKLGLTVRVQYFTLPEESFPALVRRLTIINHSKRKYTVELIDGLPAIVPFGIKDWLNKNLSRTIEAWVKVGNVSKKAPFYHLNVEVSDTPDVQHITEGNFYFCFNPAKAKDKLQDVIVNVAGVFGSSSDFMTPENFFNAKSFKVPARQLTSNRTPAAMSHAKLTLPAKDSRELVSLVGHTHNVQELNKIVKKVTAKGYIDDKARQNKDLIARVMHYAFTNSASPEFDLYAGQTFLDNVLRGGLPVSLKTQEGNVAFNVFSRKHGDLERDYNYFLLAPTYFSQGNGNYRDVNQNRRNDVWFNSSVKDNSVINFLSLIQADGYNPLIVKGMSFSVIDSAKAAKVIDSSTNGNGALLKERLTTSFQPGELLTFMKQKRISFKGSQENFLIRILGACRKIELAEHGEGFWVDHWTYNLDLIESYLSVYPQNLASLLLDKKDFHFYHSAHYVLPRDERYLLTERGVRQYHSVTKGKDIPAHETGNRLRTKNGKGDIYHTHLLGKLLCLLANKIATLDPSGLGIEMEADKPGWYDSLNGLPGLLGSSMCETIEVKRLCQFLTDCFGKLELNDQKVVLFDELVTFIEELKEILAYEDDPLSFWTRTNDAKEFYRSRIRRGIDGHERALTIKDIKGFLELILKRTEAAIEKATDAQGVVATYFYHEVTDYEETGKKHLEYSHVVPKKFKRHTLPPFLEGPVHAMRVAPDANHARQLYQRLKKSPLFDKKLKMYKVNADLSGETEEIGRTRIFPSGWLENASIWLHMEYKYLLELLRSELYDEFAETFKDTLVPFFKAETYGRSTLENSSFLVSSAHEDASLHGRGFVARLSGSTAEFMHIWLLMNMGRAPFVLNAGKELCLALKPALPGWLFTKKATNVAYLDKAYQWQTITLPKDSYAFNLLGSTLVVYHNPQRRATYGKTSAVIKEITLQFVGKKKVTVSSTVIPPEYTQEIRNNKVARIDVFFG